MSPNAEYGLVALKRPWVPEWLWSSLGQLPVYQPFRWLLTNSVAAE